MLDFDEFKQKVSELKKSNDFKRIYDFLDEISKKDNKFMIRYAFKEGLCEAKNQDENYILNNAALEGNLRIIKSLIECGCKVDPKNCLGYTPLVNASDQGHLEIVKHLVSAGANIEEKGKLGKNALIWATSSNHLEVVKYLISVGANKDAKDDNGKTCIDYANSEIKNYLNSV